jgi:hypothetical protein
LTALILPGAGEFKTRPYSNNHIIYKNTGLIVFTYFFRLVGPEFQQVSRAKGKVVFSEVYSSPGVKIRVFRAADIRQ